jgi:RNA polymerase sigma factor (sigma-70 family)
VKKVEDTVIINLYFDRSEKAIQATEEKYSKYCFSIAWNILYDKEDSDECVNDTWLAAWSSIPPRKPAILSAFLGKITRNLAIDCFRRKKAAKRSTEHILELCKELEEIEDVKLLIEISNTYTNEIQRKEILEILEKFLESLKKGDCDIFIRRYWYMDSISEISARHGISESRIKSSLYRSRKKLWERVKHLYGKRI